MRNLYQKSISRKSLEEKHWKTMFSTLVQFKKQHGHFKVPENNQSLNKWIADQRINKSKISLKQKKKLDSIDFPWSAYEEQWEKRFLNLVEFFNTYGHCNVHPQYSIDPSLRQWCWYQRRKKEKLTEEQIKKLNEIGFVWSKKRESKESQNYFLNKIFWKKMFQQLCDFKSKNGHFNIPKSYDPTFRMWVSEQRINKDKLDLNHKKKLDEIGFYISKSQITWEKNYLALTLFKKKYGHCNVPSNFEDRKLKTWIFYLRKSKNKISSEQIQKLDEIGFIWNLNDAYWEELFLRLISFKEKFGHCDVPRKFKDDLYLGLWIHNQRLNKEVLSNDQKKRLDKIGFVWGLIDKKAA